MGKGVEGQRRMENKFSMFGARGKTREVRKEAVTGRKTIPALLRSTSNACYWRASVLQPYSRTAIDFGYCARLF
jgi:hypothetical protein